MLGNLFRHKEKPTDEQIKEAKQKWLDAMLIRSGELKRLVKNEQSGWKEFVALLDDYIDKCKKRKAITALDTATPETIDILKKLDHEVWFLNFIKKIPEQFIDNVEKKLEAEKKKEENVTTD